MKTHHVMNQKNRFPHDYMKRNPIVQRFAKGFSEHKTSECNVINHSGRASNTRYTGEKSFGRAVEGGQKTNTLRPHRGFDLQVAHCMLRVDSRIISHLGSTPQRRTDGRIFRHGRSRTHRTDVRRSADGSAATDNVDTKSIC